MNVYIYEYIYIFIYTYIYIYIYVLDANFRIKLRYSLLSQTKSKYNLSLSQEAKPDETSQPAFFTFHFQPFHIFLTELYIQSVKKYIQLI